MGHKRPLVRQPLVRLAGTRPKLAMYIIAGGLAALAVVTR